MTNAVAAAAVDMGPQCCGLYRSCRLRGRKTRL